ncbi:MAG TPA: hypothetical protein O0X97_01250 [Methanocorpusculum sp.]|nr:hypothetical protein [Methanocorpusculum sp.]
MNIKRIFVISLAVFLLAAVCCGAASAFSVEKGAVINPSTSLAPGDKVTAVMEIKLPKGSVNTAGKISFKSPLAGDTWTVDIIKGGTVVNTKHPASPYQYISGFDLDYDTNIILRISVSGTVSTESLGQEISVLQVSASDMYDMGIQSYSSQKQIVKSAAEPRTEITATPTQTGSSETANQNKVFLITKEAEISPAGALISGEEVTAVAEIKLPRGAVDTAGKISFKSPLAGDTWTVDIIKGGIVVNTKHPASPYLYISGWDLDYETDVTLRITVSGTVSSESSEQEISVLQISASGMNNAGSQSYSSPKQFVYDISRLNSNLAALGNAVTALDTRTASYLTYGRDVGNVESYIEQARSLYTAAQDAGTADAAAAFAHIETGNEYVTKAQRELALTALSISHSYLTAVDDTITNLYSDGEISEAELFDAKNSGLKSIYSELLGTYNAGNVPDAEVLDKLAADSLALWNEGSRTAGSSIVSTPASAHEIKPVTEAPAEPAQTEKQEYSNEFQKFIRALIAWLESLIS